VKLYAWADYSEDAEGHYFASLEAARKSLREYLADGADSTFPRTPGSTLGPITIELLVLPSPSRGLVIKILNDCGFVEARAAVEQWRGVPCGTCDECQNDVELEGGANCTRKRVIREDCPVNASEPSGHSGPSIPDSDAS